MTMFYKEETKEIIFHRITTNGKKNMKDNRIR